MVLCYSFQTAWRRHVYFCHIFLQTPQYNITGFALNRQVSSKESRILKYHFGYSPLHTIFLLHNPCRTGVISQQTDEIPSAFLVVLTVNSLRFCLSEYVYSSSSLLKHVLTAYRIPAWQFLLSPFYMCHSIVFWFALYLMTILLKHLSLSYMWHFLLVHPPTSNFF